MSKTKKVKTIRLDLSLQELIHIRDLMSISLPPDGERTVSSTLAAITRRQVREGMLWKKVVSACKNNNIPVGSEAPDYQIDICAPVLDVISSNNEEEIENIVVD